MSAVPAASGYSAISALIRRVVNLESSVNVQFGTEFISTQGGEINTNYLGQKALTDAFADLSANKILPIKISNPEATNATPSVFTIINTDFLASPKGDVLRFKNTTLPGDSGSEENYGVVMVAAPGTGGQINYRLAPGDTLKLVCTESGATNKWDSATGL